MKTRRTLIQVCLFGALLFVLPAAVRAQFDYGVNSWGTITISAYTGPGGDVTIPGTLDGLPVTALGNSAFFQCYNLTNVTITNTVTYIGSGVFADCTNLTSITIPNSVTNIGAAAFANCIGLTNATLGTNVTHIDTVAFEGCVRLTNITVDAQNQAYSSIDGALFDKNQTTLVTCPGGKSGNYAIPGGVTSIGDHAFFYCTNLTGVTIPNSVTNIGDYAFDDCLGLTGIIIPNGVTNLGNYAFEVCLNLTNIFFQGNAPLGVGAFTAFAYNTDNPNAMVYYLSGTTGWGVKYGGLWTTMLNTPQIGGNAQMRTDGNGFDFTITGDFNQPVTVEASTNLVNWQAIQTIILSGTSTNFTDEQWKNYPRRFYRVR